MPEPLYIEGTKLTPEIKFDKQNNHFLIKGKSFPEDTLKFYQPILDWINDYVETPNEKTEFVFDFEYFNSSSARMIYKIMLSLEKIMDQNKEINCYWYYKKGDLLLKERGEEIKQVVILPLSVIEKT